MKKVTVLMGGSSAEREVSLASGANCAAALKEAGYEVETVDVNMGLHMLIHEIGKRAPDVIFNALHGRNGEDGNIQVEAPGLPTRARTSDGLLRDFFDLPGLYPKEDARDARVQGELASNPQRSEAEEAEVQDLTRRLEARGVPVVRILPRQP